MIIDSRYKTIKLLGSGIWATVYKVKDIRTNKIFTLKLFQKLASKSLYEKFSAEDMHHITKIIHKNLIHVTDFGNFQNHIYYLSDYYNGAPLYNFKFNVANIDNLYDIIVQICYGLNALHSQEIVHKDLKSNNVLYRIIKNKPEVKIMDYGFTKINIENKQQKIGKALPYIAPEIYLDNEAVPQSDFYSLGVILYQLTTKTLPYTIEQIKSFIAGDNINFFPKFPNELNPKIPNGLQNLIMKLLEKNPQDRFENSESIISYINQIQLKKFQFSHRWSVINNIRFSDYIVRKDFSHRLLDFIPIVEEGNGKLIILTAGKGLGKNNSLDLFRYHILEDKYFIFDYECSKKHKDPFFALIKEFHSSLRDNKKLESDLSNISSKLDQYLFKSEEIATMMEENAEDLNCDFTTASSYLFHLSEEKPLIFIIRAAQFLTDDAIKFINHISNKIMDLPILIIISSNDPRLNSRISHPVITKIDALNYKQTEEYIIRLLNHKPPEDFIDRIWKLSNGNPLFIEEILIDLTQKQLIWKDNRFVFDQVPGDYRLPDAIEQILFENLKHLSGDNYSYLKKISGIHTVLSKKLIKHVLGISDKELFFFLKDGLNNDLIKKFDNYYYDFTYTEIKEKLDKETTEKDKIWVSRRAIDYFKNINITRVDILEGLIEHARFCNDHINERKLQLKLSELYVRKGLFESAFLEICKVIQLDFSAKIRIEEKDLKKDLRSMIEKSRWTTAREIPADLKKIIITMPNVSEKHFIFGMFYIALEKYKLAQNRFQKAFDLAIAGKNRIQAAIMLGKTYLFQNMLPEVEKCLDAIKGFKFTDDLEIIYIELKSLYLGFTGKVSEAINLIEEFLEKVGSENDINFFYNLGSIHNNLAYLYHENKIYDEAEKNYQTARRIWEKYNFRRKLVTVYNNIGDIALARGDTNRAFEYFELAMTLCRKIDCKRGKIQGLLNKGQAYNKLGEFFLSEKFLNEAYHLSRKTENTPFINTIIDNIALAKSKINNFHYYLDFIRNNVPDLLKGKIYKITPLTKTYFYYLYRIGNYDLIEILLERSGHIFQEKKENEFFHQILGAVLLQKGDLKNAKINVELSIKYSRQIQSDYAKAINFTKLSEYYLNVGNMEESKNMCKQAENLCVKNNFHYWNLVQKVLKVKIELLDKTISIRLILRDVFEILKSVRKQKYFLLELEIYGILTHVYNFQNIPKETKMYFLRYKDKVKFAVKDLPKEDKDIYLKKCYYHIKDHFRFKKLKIASRTLPGAVNWQEELYDILKLKELHRIKFLIDKTLNSLIFPHFYAIVLSDELMLRKEPFLIKGITSKRLYTCRFLQNIKRSLEKGHIIRRTQKSKHVLFVPLKIKAANVGCLIISDKGEMDFQEDEIEKISLLRFHLTSVLIRINEFSELNRKMDLMRKLVKLTDRFFTILDLEKLEQEIVIFTMDFINSTRGFLIKKDEEENYVYKVALDDSKHMLKNYSNISKLILREVQRVKQPIFVANAREENIFEGFANVDDEFLSIYCAPVIIENQIFGLLYLDNYKVTEKKLNINKRFIELLFTQISYSIKNAMYYESLHIKNREINLLQKLKSEFINIVSHELKTPLASIQGYMKLLRKAELPKKESNIVQEIGKNSDILFHTINDIINNNKFELLQSINKGIFSIKDILRIITDEMKDISKSRNMIIDLEVEEDLQQVEFNWDSIHLLVSNLILNSIRFTKDFGTITIGARRSAFQKEEINKRESLVIYVQDNGIGISDGEIDNVFKKFYELADIYAHNSGTIQYRSSGLGLGLSTVKLIAELHNGKVWINSKENEGTTVFVALPFKN